MPCPPCPVPGRSGAGSSSGSARSRSAAVVSPTCSPPGPPPVDRPRHLGHPLLDVGRPQPVRDLRPQARRPRRVSRPLPTRSRPPCRAWTSASSSRSRPGSATRSPWSARCTTRCRRTTTARSRCSPARRPSGPTRPRRPCPITPISAWWPAGCGESGPTACPAMSASPGSRS